MITKFPWIHNIKGREKFRIGIIGLGNISNIHIKAFQMNTSVKIHAIADTNISLLNSKKLLIKDVDSYIDYHEILNDPLVDVVDILLPHYLHSKVICEALESGKHVICEKPLATSLKEIDAIITISRKTKKYVYLKQYFRFTTLHEEVKSAILRGDIGRPYLISCMYTTNALDSYNDKKSWRGNIYEAGGGIFMDVGVHIVDFLQEFFGPPISVVGIINKNFTLLDTKGEDMSIVTLEFRGGISANIICTAADTSYGFRWEKHFYGSDGSFHLVDFGKDRMEMKLQKNQRIFNEQIESNWWDNANIRALNDIVGRLVRHEPPGITLVDAKHTVRSILGAYQSSKQRKKIILN